MKVIKSYAIDHHKPETASDDEKWFLTVIYKDGSVGHCEIKEVSFNVITHLQKKDRERS